MPLPLLSSIASNIELAPDGIWASPFISAISYPGEDNDACFAVEANSFWFTHRNECILDVVRTFPPLEAFFDIGGGNGFVAKMLQDNGIDVVLVEPGLDGVRNALRRGISNVVRSTLRDAGFLPSVLPAVGLFDVVEHIQDDHAFMSDIFRHLIPGGRVYLTVPAFQWLWSHEDVQAGHWRRYTLNNICALLDNSGFQVEFATYFFAFLILPIFFSRVLPFRFYLARKTDIHQTLHHDHQIVNPIANRLISWFRNRELARIAVGRPLKLGGSCLVVARKPGP